MGQQAAVGQALALATGINHIGHGRQFQVEEQGKDRPQDQQNPNRERVSQQMTNIVFVQVGLVGRNQSQPEEIDQQPGPQPTD